MNNSMNAAQFIDTHGAQGIFRRWLIEKEVNDFLHQNVVGGVVLVDVLTGHGMQDTISPQLLESCKNLMGDKAGTPDQIANMLTEKMMLGDAATLGFINKIKGQIGEDVFVDTANHAGFTARLADLGNQEAWDVAATNSHGITEYYQVKTMASADAVVERMHEVGDKVAAGLIHDGDKVVDKISFAVPDDIYHEVVAKAASDGLDVKVMAFHLSAHDAAQIVQDGFDNAAYYGLGNFFQQLAGGTLTAVALHTMVQAYLLHKGAIEAQGLLNEVATKGVAAGGGIAAALGMEALLKAVGVTTGSLPAVAIIMATALSVRGMVNRIISRQGYEAWLTTENAQITKQIDNIYEGVAVRI